MSKTFTRGVLFSALGLLVSAPAFAATTDSGNVSPSHTENKAPGNELPPPQSSHDPRPAVPTLNSGEKSPTVVEQAGVGGPVAYGRAGVLELGGGMTWSQTSNDTLLAVTPTVGWFFTDNLELSAIGQVNYNRAGTASTTYVTGLLEPSVHVPVSDQAFVFGGWGFGATYNRGVGTGFAMAPRLGLNVLIGRSGVLTPSATMNWSSNSAIQTPQGTLVAVSTTWGANIGYTVMW
ncbi:MAG TPA: hypothetical protein VFH51_03360 [Myxococcota bacterium]|nr:hypothetical protein [Myxococcota bacterium]